MDKQYEKGDITAFYVNETRKLFVINVYQDDDIELWAGTEISAVEVNEGVFSIFFSTNPVAEPDCIIEVIVDLFNAKKLLSHFHTWKRRSTHTQGL